LSFSPNNPQFEQRVRESFDRQGFMQTLGAVLARVEVGAVSIELPYSPALSQQHGYFHGGVIGTLADNACGYAAFTLMRAEDSVLTAEYKVNLLAPGDGEKLIARAKVLRPGRTLTVCEARVYAVKGDKQKLCATALATLITLANQSDDAQRGGADRIQ
jgi:uncharacterized protein (TIGR00369 family)